MKTVAAIHTAAPMVEPTKQLFSEHLPDVRLFNIADDSLIQDVIRDGGVSPRTARRLIGYYFAAVDTGADLIFNTCSSVGEIADAAAPLVSAPIVKIDDAMTAQAVRQGKRIGVLATLSTTLKPTVNLLQKQAENNNKSVQVIKGLAKGAFEAVISGNAEKHDALIRETARTLTDQVDLFVLAQGSMARMQETLSRETGKPVLASPLLGVLDVKKTLSQMP